MDFDCASKFVSGYVFEFELEVFTWGVNDDDHDMSHLADMGTSNETFRF